MLPDVTAPVFLFCPDDILLVVSLGTPSATASWTAPVVQDNSGTVSLVSQTASPGDSFQAATTSTVVYVYADDSGNTATCSFDVTVNTRECFEPSTFWLCAKNLNHCTII